MAAYRRVYDSRHLQADCQEPGSAPRSVIEYGLPLPFRPTVCQETWHLSNLRWPFPSFAAPCKRKFNVVQQIMASQLHERDYWLPMCRDGSMHDGAIAESWRARAIATSSSPKPNSVSIRQTVTADTWRLKPCDRSSPKKIDTAMNAQTFRAIDITGRIHHCC